MNEHLKSQALAFRSLHRGSRALILPNAWDVISARIVEEAGYPAIATTSAGIAFSLGYPDGERISREEMLARMAGYAERDIANGGRLSAITRHMLGLYGGQPGAKEYRRYLSEGAREAGAGPELLRNAGRRAASQLAEGPMSI